MADSKYRRSSRYPELFSPSGSKKWWCFLPNPDGHGRALRESTGHVDETAAHHWYLERVRHAHVVPAREISLLKALDLHLDDCRMRGRSAGTIDCYQKKSNAVLRVLDPMMMCSALTAEMIDDYVKTRLETVTRSNVARELLVLRKSLNIVRRLEYDAPDPRLVLPLNFGSDYKPRERRLTIAQVDRLLAEGGLLPYQRAITALIVAVGATYPSELAEFSRAQVTGHTVHVRGTKRDTRDRRVPVPKFARGWLEIGLAGVPLPRWANVRRDLGAACERAGVPRVTPNDLRRTIGSLLRAKGAPPDLIGLYLGHADSRMAERVYGRVTPDELARLLGKFG